MLAAVIDYGSGNLRSAAKALERARDAAGLGGEIAVTADPDLVATADRVVLPGVGAFADCRAGLLAASGMVDALTEAARARARPFLGVCVGMQLLADEGLEHGRHPGLGWIAGQVRALRPADPALKIPHMGWNTLTLTARGAAHSVLAGLQDGDHAYFVHSYAFELGAPDDLLASTDYGGPIAAVIGRGNLVGTQFHPEKSQRAGLRLLGNFLAWMP